MHEKPTCLSFIVCDAIYRDENTKKLIVVGVFNNITTHGLPAIHSKMCILFTLTDGRGKVDLSLSIEHEKTGAQIVEMRGPLQMDSPLMIRDFHVEFGNLQFPAEGKYWIILKADGEIVNQRPFRVSLVGRPEKDKEQGDA
ncbi:MAG: hypothetical protein BIFFINMI_02927 [Phycisphaerae bacterium]|nr:hypothetical protein [Phycisphaerae bacterium]